MASKVLVVDDDPIMHRVLKHYLAGKGCHMLQASSAREALELAASQVPDLIVLDVRMPEMNGLEALRRLKEMPATKAIPVIVVTVNADRATQIQSEMSGAAAFLPKPFRPAELLDLMDRLVPPDSQAKAGPRSS